MSTYKPDKWVILQFKQAEGTFFKVLGSWYGGYTQGDSWRLSSGLERVEEDGDTLLMHNYSGSIYKVNKNSNGMNMIASGVYSQAVEEGKENGVDISIVTLEQFKESKKNG